APEAPSRAPSAAPTAKWTIVLVHIGVELLGDVPIRPVWTSPSPPDCVLAGCPPSAWPLPPAASAPALSRSRRTSSRTTGGAAATTSGLTAASCCPAGGHARLAAEHRHLRSHALRLRPGHPRERRDRVRRLACAPQHQARHRRR